VNQAKVKYSYKANRDDFWTTYLAWIYRSFLWVWYASNSGVHIWNFCFWPRLKLFLVALFYHKLEELLITLWTQQLNWATPKRCWGFIQNPKKTSWGPWLQWSHAGEVSYKNCLKSLFYVFLRLTKLASVKIQMWTPLISNKSVFAHSYCWNRKFEHGGQISMRINQNQFTSFSPMNGCLFLISRNWFFKKKC
jgi:hypothetical protein